MTRVLRAMPDMLRVALAEAVAWRAEMLIWILTATMPLIMLAIWDAVAANGPVAGLGQADMARYFTVALVIRQVTSCWVVWELNETIRSGTLSAQLLRPISPIWYNVARHWVALPMRATVLLPLVAALYFWRPEIALDFDPARIGVTLLSSALAWALAFAMQVVFGCLAFWSGQSLGLFNVWFGLWSALGGYLVPLRVMPDLLRGIANELPFRCMLSVPVEIGAGQAGPELWAGLLLRQTAWLAVAVLLAVKVWRAGLKRYGAFGA